MYILTSELKDDGTTPMPLAQPANSPSLVKEMERLDRVEPWRLLVTKLGSWVKEDGPYTEKGAWLPQLKSTITYTKGKGHSKLRPSGQVFR